LQTPGARDAEGASGAKQSATLGGQTLQGPTVQSLSCVQLVAHTLPLQPYGAQYIDGAGGQTPWKHVRAAMATPAPHTAWPHVVPNA
jgi:hypothetical protein